MYPIITAYVDDVLRKCHFISDKVMHRDNVGLVGFNVPLDTLRVISRRFCRSDDPTNSVIALKDDG